jgi:hypothetical protein
LGIAGGASIVANAFILTTVAFGGLSVFVKIKIDCFRVSL